MLLQQLRELQLMCVHDRIGPKNLGKIQNGTFTKNEPSRKTPKSVSFKRNIKSGLIQFFDKYPHARVTDAVDELTKSFEGFRLKETVVGKFISTECNLRIIQLQETKVLRET